MTQPVICPSCQNRGNVPETHLGQNIKCPKCGTRFVAMGRDTGAPAPAAKLKPVAAPTGPDLDDLFADVEPASVAPPLQRRGAAPQYQEADESTGMSPALVKIIVGVGAAVAAIVAVIVIINGQRPDANEVGANRPNSISLKDVGKNLSAEPDVPQAGSTVPFATPVPSATTANVTPSAIASPAPASAPSAASVIQNLLDATVYIKLKLNGKLLSTGTGFVVDGRSKGGGVVMATNRHVVSPDLDDLPADINVKDAQLTMEVVFRSGEPGKEQVLPGKLIAVDPTDDLENDIAFVVAEGVKDPPQPIVLDNSIEPALGMSYQGAGFPLGGMINQISETPGNPSITITKGGIAALRRSEFGPVNLIQVDGSLQPGNSGGPMVDAATGRLLGMAVAKLGVDTIGFLVPAANIKRARDGRVEASRLTLNEPPVGKLDLSVEAYLMDPRGQIKEVAVYLAPGDNPSAINPLPDGTWPPLPGGTPFVLKLDPMKGVAGGRMSMQLPNPGPLKNLIVQTAHTDLDGKHVYHMPKKVELPPGKGQILAKNSMAKLIEKMARKSQAKLATLIDPSQDCHLTRETDEGILKIHIPGKLHTLAPEVLKAKKPLHNAPRALIDVKGDFAAMVAIIGDINPGSTKVKDPGGKLLQGTFQGAGLLLYQNDKNFLRLERTSFLTGSPVLEQKLLIEVVKDGKHAIAPIYFDVPEGEMMLILLRRNGRITCLIALEGKRLIGTRELVFDFPDDVKVGVSASNVSAKPFEATFKDFVLMTDKDQIQQEFGSEEE